MKVTLTDIRKAYKGRTVLDIDRLEFQKGKIYAVLGLNGSGKSTMIRIIAGVEKADSGKIFFDGNTSGVTDSIAYLPQERYLFDTSVIKNITVAIAKDKDSKNRAINALESVNMKEFANASARSLSGGEAQRVAVARTLVLNKQLILLDEPAASIDNLSSMLVESYILKVNKDAGSTIVFSTHSPSQAARVADEAIIMWNGTAIERGKPSEIFESPGREETRMFLQNWRI